MTLALEDLPDDIAALKALLLAERAQSDRLRHLLAQLRRAHFGAKSEKLNTDQLNLGFEDIETAVAAEEARLEKTDATLKAASTQKRKANRSHLPTHLPREEIVVEPTTKSLPLLWRRTASDRRGSLRAARQGAGETACARDSPTEVRLSKLREDRRRRCCRYRAGARAGALDRRRHPDGSTRRRRARIKIRRPHSALIFTRDGIVIDRSTLCHWVGFGAAELEPLYARLIQHLMRSTKLFCDETRCPVLDPGRGKTKTGYLWAVARDDRP
jgi:transposase